MINLSVDNEVSSSGVRYFRLRVVTRGNDGRVEHRLCMGVLEDSSAIHLAAILEDLARTLREDVDET